MRKAEDWEEIFAPSRREMRSERKRITRQDRSKYKKTDQKKGSVQRAVSSQHRLGKVIRIRSKNIEVAIEKKVYTCSLRGVLKQERTKDKNLVIVGDNVWTLLLDETSGVIQQIAPRTAVLCRQEHLHRKKQQLVAANVDQVIITVALAEPICKTTIIDRYLIAAHKGNLTPLIVFNKLDLKKRYPKQGSLIKEYHHLYSSLGIPSILISARDGEGLDLLKKALKEKTSVFSGQSGTGKSEIINALTGLSLTTRSVRAVGKGAHTTTFAQLLSLPFGGWCVDTPGIRSFGVWDLEKQDLRNAFPDLFDQPCAFHNCWHIGEEGCKVPEAIEKKLISPLRLHSYLALLASV